MVDVVGSRWWFVVGVWKESTRTCAAARAEERTFGIVRKAFELDLQNQDFDLSRSDPP